MSNLRSALSDSKVAVTSTPLWMQRLNVSKRTLLPWLEALAPAAAYATLIVAFVIQSVFVHGQSMAPTISDGDRLIVNKFVYRIGEPRRGDIVMLYYPPDPDKLFVKRVIAKEGDQVCIVDGRVYLNDVPMPDVFVPPAYRSHDDHGPMAVRAGYYFVMGDHRNGSSDSRHWVRCRRNTSSAKCSCGGGPFRRRVSFDALHLCPGTHRLTAMHAPTSYE